MCLFGKNSFPKKTTPLHFSRFEIDLSGFEEWLQLGGLQVEHTKRSLSLKSKNVKDIVFDTDAGRLMISHHTEVPEGRSVYLSQLTVKEVNILSLKPRRAFSPEAVRREFAVLQDLMILLTDTHYSLSWPVVQISRTKSAFTFYFRRIASSATSPRFFDMPTSFPQLEDKFGQIFSSWRTKREEFGSGFHAYISTNRDISFYAEGKFMALIQGLESFHRSKSGVAKLNNRLRAKIDRILGDVKLTKDKIWLERTLRHSAEPRLSDRLVEILTSLPLGLEQGRIEKFAQECAAIRNDLAHFGGQKTRKESANYLQEIVEKSQALSLLYQMALWREIGIDDAQLLLIFSGFGAHRRKHTLATVQLLSPEVINA